MLSDIDLERYARQVIIPDMGEDGQKALLEAKVLIVGAGGLGAPVLLYLASAGIGRITIIDDDLANILFSFERHFTKFWPTKPNPPVIKIFSLYNFYSSAYKTASSIL